MRRARLVPLAVALLAAAMPANALGESRTHVIVVDQMAFSPVTVNLTAGDTVEWVNKDIFVHSATADDGSFDLDLPVNGRAELVVKHAGRIAYHCKYHPGMKGELRVDASAGHESR